MQVEAALFVGFFLSSFIVFAFFAEQVSNQRIIVKRRKVNLKKKKCEICASVYFISVFFEFWECPVCGSINKEQ